MKAANRCATHLTLFALIVCLWHVRAEAGPVCSAQQFCTEVSSFTAAVTDFRTSASGHSRLASATVRLTNKTDQPLVLGYVQGSGVIIDELGNRYSIDTRDPNNVRAIGIVTSRNFDPKFALRPGESSDARFQFDWYAGSKPVGTRFQLEVTIREIDAVANNQMKLGREHVVQFLSLADGASSTHTPAAPATQAAALGPASPDVSAATPATSSDSCAAQPQCYDAGAFTAQVMQVTASNSGSNHLVRLNVKFRNVSGEPLILGYQKNSGSMIDEQGNRYTIDTRYPDRVKGIGLVEARSADPQFVLRPGESRDATFEYSRYAGRNPPTHGTFAPDFAIAQLEVLSSQQVRQVREYSINFRDLKQGSLPTAFGETNDTLEAINNVGEASKRLGEGLKSLFKKK